MASSSSRSGVHIQVTSGVPFTSSQTGTSSTAAGSAIRPPRLAGRIGPPGGSGFPGAGGMESGVLGHAHAVESDAVGKPGGELPEQIAGERLAGGERLPIGELRHREVEVLLVVGRHHLLGARKSTRLN